MSDLKPISVRDRLAYFNQSSFIDDDSGRQRAVYAAERQEQRLAGPLIAPDTLHYEANDWGTLRAPPRMAPPPTPPSMTATPLSQQREVWREASSTGNTQTGSTRQGFTGLDSSGRPNGAGRSTRKPAIIRTPVPQTPSPPTPWSSENARSQSSQSVRGPTEDVTRSTDYQGHVSERRTPPAMRVLCIVYDYVEDTEFFVAEAALRAVGIDVDVASPSATRAGSVVRSVVRVSDDTAGEAVLRAADLDGHRIRTNLGFLQATQTHHARESGQRQSSVPDAKTASCLAPAEEAIIREWSERYAALILPGGRLSGALAVAHRYPSLLRLIQAFHERGRIIAAISTAPVLLSAAGLTVTGELGVSLTAHPLVKDDIYPPSAYLQRIDWEPDELEQQRCDSGAARNEPPASVAVADANVVTAACWQGHPQYLSQVLCMLGVTVRGNDLRVLVLTESGCELTEILASVQVLQTLGLTVDVGLPPPPQPAGLGEASATRRRRFFTVLREYEARPAVQGEPSTDEEPLIYHERPCRSFEASISDVTSVSPYEYDGILITGGSSAWRIRSHERVLQWIAKPLLRPTRKRETHIETHTAAGSTAAVAGTRTTSWTQQQQQQQQQQMLPGAPVIGAIGEGALVLLAATRFVGANTCREVTGFPGYVPPGSGFVMPRTPFDIHRDGHVVTCASWLAVPEFLRTFLEAMGCETHV